MQFTLFSFVMSLLWFNLYIIIINSFRKNDNFIISFTTFPLVFFLILSAFRLIFNFEVPGSIIIESQTIFPKIYDFLRIPLNLKGFNINIIQIFIVIWSIVAIVLLIKDIIRYRKFKNDLQGLERTRNKENEQIFNKILDKYQVSEKIKIIQHDDISSPFILGLLKGKIHIPNIGFSEEELEYIILHEINHFKRKDSLKKILIQSIKNIFWCNPFSHLFANNFDHILEIQCDLKTTSNFTDDKKIRYLESITKIIKDSTNDIVEDSSVPMLVNVEEIDFLKQRFRIVLNHKPKRNLFKLLSLILCVLALIINILSYFIIIQPDYLPDEKDSLLTSEELNLQEDSFIIKNSKGQYELYIDNLFQHIIDDINEDKYRDIPVYEEGSD